MTTTTIINICIAVLNVAAVCGVVFYRAKSRYRKGLYDGLSKGLEAATEAVQEIRAGNPLNTQAHELAMLFGEKMAIKGECLK